jgi:hypothetical protein
MKNRIFLLFGYWLLAFLVVYFFGGYGHGSFFPLFILASWPGFFSKLISNLLNYPKAGIIFGEGLIIGLSLFVLYYLGLMKLVSKLSLTSNKNLRFIPGAIHFGGGLAFILISDKQGILPEGPWMTSFYVASYIVSLALTLLWLLIDWRLAKRIRAKVEQTLVNQD